MTLPALPAQGTTSWYPWAQGIHEAAKGANEFWLGTAALNVASGTPGGPNNIGYASVWQFSDGEYDALYRQLYVPDHWATFNVDAHLVNLGASPGNVVMRVDRKAVVDGDLITAGPTAGSNVTVALTTQYAEKFAPIASGVPVDPSKKLHLIIGRLGADASDTLAAAVGLVGVRVSRAS